MAGTKRRTAEPAFSRETAEVRKAALIQAARESLAERGMGAVSVRDVARRHGASPEWFSTTPGRALAPPSGYAVDGTSVWDLLWTTEDPQSAGSRRDPPLHHLVELEDRADAAAIDRYVDGGGRIVVTADTGACDETGCPRCSPALAAACSRVAPASVRVLMRSKSALTVVSTPVPTL